MASAIRLMNSPPESVAIVGTGPFGVRCGEILAAGLTGSRQLTASEITAAFAAGPGAVVLALWRPESGLCETADELSFRHGVCWLPVIMEHPVIRIGPLVCPPAGPCFGCYARRRAQHDVLPWTTDALRAAYDSDRTCGPQGYLPHQARMAAAVAHDMLGRLTMRAEGTAAGAVTTIRLNGGHGTSRVVACHGCPRCGPGALSGKTSVISELSLRARGVGDDSGARSENRHLAVR